MLIVFYLLVFILGAIVGSFLNCLVYRLEKGKSMAGRSFCPKCKRQLGLWDLIPVLSFVFLRGKCRYCNKRISWQYPLVEIITGVLFLLIFNFQFLIFKQFSIFNFQTLVSLAYLLIIGSVLIIVFIYDLKTYLIPDKVVYPAIVLALLFRLLTDWSSLPMALLAGLGASAFFFIIWAISRGKWMGFGDVKLALLMGLFLGWPSILVALFSAFFIGAIIGIGLMIAKKKQLKSQVPFGPFLVIGAFIALFWGEQIINWYLNFL